ncbi:MAG: ferredoxin [Polyangiaceae bacterium]|nr:ferredoxin [Polyangiaceae bacterium]
MEGSKPEGITYSVLTERCFRCGACSSLAPHTFGMDAVTAYIRAQPESPESLTYAEAAKVNCPARAIGRAGGEPPPNALCGVVEGPFHKLFEEAERVRWKMSDIPWHAIDKEVVNKPLLRFVREMALSELTTFSATKRFMSEMADDPDFTNWLAIWFYEETKHPDALFRWLRVFGVEPTRDEVLRGRVTAPFMRSKTGTLAMNILSELFASAGYQDLARYTKEPVLAGIFEHLAGDEARHGSSFYVYTARAIGLSKTPEIERQQVLKVLYYWVQAAGNVEHPVNQFHEKVAADPELLAVLRDVGTDYQPVLQRACRLIGTLVGLPLREPEDVLPALRLAQT